MGQLASVIGGRLAKILADDDQETRTVSACSYYVLRSNRWQSLMLGRGSRLLIVLALGFSPDFPDELSFRGHRAPISVGNSGSCAESDGRIQTDATGERRNPRFRQ